MRINSSTITFYFVWLATNLSISTGQSLAPSFTPTTPTTAAPTVTPTIAPTVAPTISSYPTFTAAPTLKPTRRAKKCRDIASNRFDLPRIGRVARRKGVKCKWFRDVYKNKRIKRKYCGRKVLITRGPKKGRRVKLNLICKAACLVINAGWKQCIENQED